MADVSLAGLFVIAIWWLVGSIAVGIAAKERGYFGVAWFLISLLLGPLLAVLLLIAHPVVVVSDIPAGSDGLSISPQP